MDLAPVQHQQASAVWFKARSLFSGKGEDGVSSSTNAVKALLFLNLPYPAAYHIIKYRTTRQAIAEWPETWNARWVAPILPSKKHSLLAEHVSTRVADVLQGFKSKLLLSHMTTVKNRWWTLITTNFTHVSLAHLAGNMLALISIRPVLVKVPGMTASHVFGIAIATSLVTSLQTLNRPPDTWSWSSCGFSAIVCAFTSVAALGGPQDEPVMYGDNAGSPPRLFLLMGLQVLTDMVSVLRSKHNNGGGLRPGETQTVNYVGHLVGYACGAAYYAFFLWQSSSNDNDRDDDEAGEIPEQPVDVMNELLKTRDQPAPVRESEDWEEVASKLGYSAADQ